MTIWDILGMIGLASPVIAAVVVALALCVTASDADDAIEAASRKHAAHRGTWQ